MSLGHGRHAAEIFGNLKDPTWYEADSWRDHWNNEVGRRMADWAIEHGYGPQILDRLMMDAYLNGDGRGAALRLQRHPHLYQGRLGRRRRRRSGQHSVRRGDAAGGGFHPVGPAFDPGRSARALRKYPQRG